MGKFQENIKIKQNREFVVVKEFYQFSKIESFNKLIARVNNWLLEYETIIQVMNTQVIEVSSEGYVFIVTFKTCFEGFY